MRKIILLAAAFSFLALPVSGFFYQENDDNLKQVYPKQYKNYAEQGIYENLPWVNEYYPSFRYYDLFGNHVIDGYYIYSIGQRKTSLGTGGSNIYTTELYKKWFSGLIVAGDVLENRGILGIVGDHINSMFTPYTFKQTLYNGVRLDLFFNLNYLSVLTSRISNPGKSALLQGSPYGIWDDKSDWLTGLRFSKLFGETAKVAGSYLNIRHDEGSEKSNPFSGVDSDTATVATPTALSVFGTDFAFKYMDFDVSGEISRSQEYLDGKGKAEPGSVFSLNADKKVSETVSAGGEIYSISPYYKTSFFCPAHPYGDGSSASVLFTGHYLYQLVEDNDDNDEYPENGRSRLSEFPTGDPDGVIPDKYDRNKDDIWDFTQDFLSYEVDPPKSRLYVDRNNNLVCDQAEDDAYPDYLHVPSFYTEGETYLRYDDAAKAKKNNTATDNASVHKGLQGVHAYSAVQVTPEFKVTAGILMDKSLEKTYQRNYITATSYQTVLEEEKATSIYGTFQYRKDLERKGIITVTDMPMKINDGIPNHTAEYSIDALTSKPTYYLTIDELPLRNSLLNRAEIEYSLEQTRGLNIVSRANLELGSHSEETKYLYPKRGTCYAVFLNKCKYIYPAPWSFLNGLFIIPQYKVMYENASYSYTGNTSSPLDAFYDKNTLTNWVNLVNEYKLTPKTRLTVAYGIKWFDDLQKASENYFERNFTSQVLLNDHYRGFNVYMTIGFTNYQYLFDASNTAHNAANNPHGATADITFNEFFLRVHCGF